MKAQQIYLASSSPRRAELLAQIGVSYQVIEIDIPEFPKSGELPREFALRLAIEKAQAGLQQARLPIPVLAADTIVVCNDEILGKPTDVIQAQAMLTSLSGMTHCVMTAVAVCVHDRLETVLSETMVDFRKLTEQEITAYCLTGEPLDKAGSYAIQGLGAIFVNSIRGSYSGTVGLPLMETATLLAKFGVVCI